MGSFPIFNPKEKVRDSRHVAISAFVKTDGEPGEKGPTRRPKTAVGSEARAFPSYFFALNLQHPPVPALVPVECVSYLSSVI